MTLNLESPGALPALARRIKSDIDDYCVWKYNEGVGRSHLGASLIGHECSYYLCLSFRWAHHTVESGRQYRLFQRGHSEEAKIVDLLTGIGCTVKCFDDEHLEDTHIDKGHRQIRISACKGHFGGSIDGMLKLPERFGIPDDVIFLAEMKTQGVGKKGKNFEELVAKGVKAKKAQHFAQMSIYGYKLGLKYGVYISVCKNDDDIHIEVIKLDWSLGEALERKAGMIIFGETPPSKISMSPAYFTCVYCNMLGVCHNGEPIDRNCRSCKNCSPIDNAEWYCGHWNNIIPKEFLIQGCDNWISFF